MLYFDRLHPVPVNRVKEAELLSQDETGLLMDVLSTPRRRWLLLCLALDKAQSPTPNTGVFFDC